MGRLLGGRPESFNACEQQFAMVGSLDVPTSLSAGPGASAHSNGGFAAGAGRMGAPQAHTKASQMETRRIALIAIRRC